MTAVSDPTAPSSTAPPGNRLPTMSDVAAAAGVSRQLVSLVLRGAPGPSEESRVRVLAAATSLGYRPNASARLLRQSRSRQIGVLFAAVNSFQARVVERLLERAADLGYGVVLGPTTTRRTTEVVVRQLLEQRIEALACFNPDPAAPALQQALELMPVVWLGERAHDARADVVRTDDDTGLQLLVGHLRSLGHRDIAYAGGLGGSVGADRAQTYRDAMIAHRLRRRIDVIDVGFGEEDGASAAATVVARDDRPTAVICCSDHCAAGLLAGLRRAGIDVPEQISVTGYDDSDVAALSYHDLTSVRQDVDLTVDATLAAITRRLSDPAKAPQEVPTAATLTIRGSTGRAPGGHA